MLAEGTIPEISIFMESLTEVRAFFWERYLIASFGRRDQGTGCLCNHTDGGEGVAGLKFSPMTLERLSLVHRGCRQSPESIEKIATALRGRKRPKEVGQKIAAKKRGKPISEEHRAKLVAWRKANPLTEVQKIKLAAGRCASYARRRELCFQTPCTETQ
jgi:hypothetical protein